MNFKPHFLCLSLLFLTSCAQEDEIEEIGKYIDWIEITQQELVQERKISGILEPTLTAALSFEVPGLVTMVNVDLGSEVKKDDILAEIDKRDYMSELNSAKAEFLNAESLYIRTKKAYEGDAVSKQEVSDAAAQLEVAEANYKIKQKALDDTYLKAPYDGVITDRNVETAQQVQVGEGILQIDGQQGLEVAVNIPETIIDHVELDEIYDVTFPAFPTIKSKAKLTEVSTAAGTANAFPATLQLQEELGRIKSGMTAEVTFIYKMDQGKPYAGKIFLIPNSAIGVGLAQDMFIFLYNKDTHTIRKVTIQPINMIDNNAYIIADLNIGDILANAGLAYLRDGQKVNLMNKNVQQFN